MQMILDAAVQIIAGTARSMGSRGGGLMMANLTKKQKDKRFKN